MEPTRLASIARPDAGSADRTYVSICRAYLSASFTGQDASVEKNRASHGKHASVRGHLPGGVGTISRSRITRLRRPRRNSRHTPLPEHQTPRRHRIPASLKSAAICNSIGSWYRKASCRKRARNWKRFRLWWGSKFDARSLPAFGQCQRWEMNTRPPCESPSA